MKYIKNSITCLILFINLIGIGVVFYFSIENDSKRKLSEISQKNYYNLRGTILNTKKSLNLKQGNQINKYMNDAQLNKSKIRNNKTLRKLSYNFDYNFIIIANIVPSYFCFLLMISFCLDSKYEKSYTLKGGSSSSSSSSSNNNNSSKSSGGDCGNCNCNGGGEGLGVLALICLLIIIFIAITYVLTSLIGKLASRYVSLISIIVSELVICIYCLVLNSYKEIIIYIIAGISGLLIISNFLVVLLPNLICNQNEDIPNNPGEIALIPPEVNVNKNGEILSNNKSVVTPMNIPINNYDNKGIDTTPKDTLNYNINDASDTSSNYGAPLPTPYDFPSEQELQAKEFK